MQQYGLIVVRVGFWGAVMTVSVRAYLLAGAAAATATTIALTAVQVTPADVAVPAHPTSPQPELSQAMVDLLAAAGRMRMAIPAPSMPLAPSARSAPAASAQPTATAIAPNLADTIDNVYVTVEPWVQYGFEVAAYALGWVPWVGGWAGGLLLDGYNFGQSIAASAVFNFTDFLRGDGGIVTNLADFGVDVALSFAWLAIDVVNTFVPLPPIPLPPRPPLQGPLLASTLAGPTTAAVSLTGAIQDSIDKLTDALTGAGELQRDPSEVGVEATSEGTTLDEHSDVATVPASVKESLSPVDVTVTAPEEATDTQPTDTQPTDTEATDTEATPEVTDTEKPAKSTQSAVKNVKRDLQKATAGLRSVVKDIRDGLVKPRKPFDKPARQDTETAADGATQPATSQPAKSQPAKSQPRRGSKDRKDHNGGAQGSPNSSSSSPGDNSDD